MPLANQKSYTIEDIYNLPEGARAELIDGSLYMMASPSRMHQEIVGELFGVIRDYVKKENGSCKTYVAPFAVFLNQDDRTYVEPDISVICDKSKLDDRGCVGAPDWIIEIASPSTKRTDYGVKLFKYRSAGVREYWIVNPAKKIVNVYCFDDEENTDLYSFEDNIPVGIYPGFSINIQELLK